MGWSASSTFGIVYEPGLRENAEVVGADEAFFEDEDSSETIVNLYHERAGILDGDPEGEVDLGVSRVPDMEECHQRGPEIGGGRG